MRCRWLQAKGLAELFGRAFLNHELARQFRRMQYVFDAFICERIHLRVKKVAVRVTNTSDFEMSVLLRIVRAQIYAINCENALKDGCLMGKITRNPAGRGLDLNIALSLRIGFLISREDIVFSESCGGIVEYCFQDRVSGQLFAVVNCLEKVEDNTPNSARYRRVDGTIKAWYAESLVAPMAWYPSGDGRDFIVVW